MQKFFVDEIDSLTRIEVKLKNALLKLCGGSRIIDILFHYPTKIIDRSTICDLSTSNPGEITTLVVKVINIQTIKTRNSFNSKPYHKIICNAGTKAFNIIFFNYPYLGLCEQFKLGEYYIVSGKLEKFQCMIHPQKVAKLSDLDKICKIHTIYPLSKTLTQANFSKVIDKALEYIQSVTEEVISVWPEKFFTFKNALLKLHRPNNLVDVERARVRLALDELLAHQLYLYKHLREGIAQKTEIIKGDGHLIKKIISQVGFTLTTEQIKVVEEIKNDQAQLKYMRRVLQGDVGSGKTIVAFIALINVIECGYQGVFMVPTTLLAEQVVHWMNKVSAGIIKIGLLTGSSKISHKNKLLKELAIGGVDILVGTHAVCSEEIKFKKLGLVVIDEQHKFGVNQRLKLINKDLVDVLLISATPIPRTLTQILYGNFTCSRILSKPENRLPIITRLIKKTNYPEVISRIKNFIIEGNKVFWVCPAIDECDVLSIAAVTTRFEEFKSTFGSQVGVLHSKLSADLQEKTITAFRNNDITILITTTVIEIGIDIPDANVMVIEDAERFGLAQLHQLRGRVGRSKIKSYCILLYNSSYSCAFQRLKILRESQDGFYIAEQDLKNRGQGDLIGFRQAGAPHFIFADFSKDEELLKLANQQALKIIAQKEFNKFKCLLEIFKLWEKDFLY